MTSPRFRLLAAVVAALLAACAPLPPLAARPADAALMISRVASPNFDQRRPNLVIIHHTTNSTLEQALLTLTSAERKLSAHYLIGRDGRIVQLVDESARAWHAGKSWWAGFSDVNSASIGIELDNSGSEPFADAQIDSLLALLADIRQRHYIPAANFIGHADVAPTRKNDPSALFPWARLAESGFGLWCEVPLPPAPAGADLQLVLAAIGYDPATPEASRQAFRRHFLAGDAAASNADEIALAYCLLQKKAAARP
jgi:N-acetylmuramoyl-L-alanine amidase